MFFGGVETRGATTTEATRRWRNGKIYWSYAPGYTQLSNTRTAINRLEQEFTSLSFTEVATNYTGDYIYFQEASGSSSYIGKIGGRQEINIAPTAGWGTVAHEIMHALGIFHEQSREDRDDYIVINWDVIPSNTSNNFQKFSQLGYTGKDIYPFDFNSIMLYDSWAGSTTGAPSMTTLDGKTWYSQRNYFSTGDQWSLRFLYGPPHGTLRSDESNLTVTTSPTVWRQEGYVKYYLEFDSPTEYDRSIVYHHAVQEIINGQYVHRILSTPVVYIPKGTTIVNLQDYCRVNIHEEYGTTYTHYVEYV